MTEIVQGSGLMTLINVFTVKPGKQQELVDFLTTSTRDVMSRFPGFVSANIHRSRDGRFVTNYAQWETQEAWEAMQRQPDAQAEFAQVYTLAEADWATYDVAYVHHRA